MRALFLRPYRNRIGLLRLAILFLVVLPCALYILLAYIVPTSPALIPPSLLISKRPVLVVAHPDDESLFFGPTVLGLTRIGDVKELRILVLSTG
jgi:N-acetylglucosaminylphosphatidylinositol deacetylase